MYLAMGGAGPGSGCVRRGPFQEAAKLRGTSWRRRYYWAGVREPEKGQEGTEAPGTSATRLFLAFARSLAETVGIFTVPYLVTPLNFTPLGDLGVLGLRPP